MEPKTIGKVAWVLVLVGGFNWGLIGWLNYDLIGKIFSNDIARVIYAIVGAATLYCIYDMYTMMNKKPAAKK